ncbi:uncharacterized protein LOC122499979 [Leptopilina heterotoma]|uniref:uncharacterized protein LOC122499979 n=1 Tax=Leptopilina heterotoma TaxID=63436 RepID=UPI001CA8732F|nr:uncharacterized protein LOC122499979 [Leptopilina heterotoma]
MASNLPLLPVNKFLDGIDEIEKEINNYPEKYHEKLRKFIKYLRKYWGPKKNNYCVGDLIHRTNNLSESANKRLFTRLGGLHPGIWKFIISLKNTIEDEEIRMRNLEQGFVDGEFLTRNNIQRNNIIRNAIQRLETGWSIKEFLCMFNNERE